MDKDIVTSRVITWLLFLQEFEITILNKPSQENVLMNFFSRLQ